MSTTDSLTFADRGSAAGDRGRLGAGRAHGKAILLGEHAVVYGAPALAIPVPQLTVTASATRFAGPGGGGDKISFSVAGPGTESLAPVAGDDLRHLVAEFKERAAISERVCVDVLIDCTIPRGCGLGSSAACARAAVLALADLFDRRLDAKAVFDLVQVSEMAAHGRASGIDAFATGATSPLYFRGGIARELPIAMVGEAPVEAPEWTTARDEVSPPWSFHGLFVIADSGVAGSTRDAVEGLRLAFERDPSARDAFVSQVSSLTNAALRDLGLGRLHELGARMTENHRLLRDVGISTDRIDAMVEAALGAGGLGAKISGGGLGGCMIALAEDPGRADEVARALRDAGAVRTWLVPVGRFASHVN